jgi:hypothetical protein
MQQMASIPLVPAVSTIAEAVPSETTVRMQCFIDHGQEFINYPSVVVREIFGGIGIHYSPRSATVRCNPNNQHRTEM